jgi:glyoxylase-like metal-dependent hydrolase (beta-lactamase superfamily II)
MKLHTIHTGNFKLDGGAMFGVVPKAIWHKLNPADENNLCTWAMRSLLIEDGNKLILIDTGIGNKQDEKFFSHYHLHGNNSLEKSLALKGFHKNDITDVILTHLHFDHVGGAIERVGDRLVPAFKQAIYLSNTLHWHWAITPNAREKASFLKENILPIQESGQLRFIETGNTNTLDTLAQANVSNQVDVLFVHGHTESMMLPKITYKNNTIVFMADLLPSAAHIPLPYIMGYDMFPLQTLHEKTIFLQEAAANNYTLFFQHDPVHECCTLTQTEKGVRPNEYFSIDSL